VASNDGAGFGSAPDQLQGIRMVDGQRVWTFRCDDDGDLALRFAGADAGDDPTAGRVTEFAEQPSVVVRCSNTTVSLNPQTGKQLKK
jgi:outer membrane protein assembly factor BamB